MHVDEQEEILCSFFWAHLLLLCRINVIWVQFIFCLFLEHPDDSPQLFREVTKQRQKYIRVALEVACHIDVMKDSFIPTLFS